MLHQLSNILIRASTGKVALLSVLVFLAFGALVLPREAVRAERVSGGRDRQTQLCCIRGMNFTPWLKSTDPWDAVPMCALATHLTSHFRLFMASSSQRRSAGS